MNNKTNTEATLSPDAEARFDEKFVEIDENTENYNDRADEWKESFEKDRADWRQIRDVKHFIAQEKEISYNLGLSQGSGCQLDKNGHLLYSSEQLEKSRQEGYENAIDDVLKVPIIQRSIFDDGSVATALQEALNRIQKEKTFTSPEATSKESA